MKQEEEPRGDDWLSRARGVASRAARRLAAEAEAVAARAPLVEGQGPSSPLGAYRGHTELVRALEDYATLGFRRKVCGRSVEGKPIHVLEIGPDAATEVSVLVAGLHALEWIGVECCLGVAERLLGAAPAGRKIVVFPLVNVDGYRAVEEDLRQGRRRFRRGNARGVDLNRNFPTFFRKTPRAAALLPGATTAGEHPLSEPEAAAVHAHLEQLTGRGATITHAVSLHSFGLKVLFPYGARWKAPPDEARLRAAAAALCDRIAAPYRPVQTSRWVPGSFAHGMEVDHLHDRFGATALLVECSSGGGTLRSPTSLLSPFRWFNPADPRPVVRDVAAAVAWFLCGAGQPSAG
jgi:hypothetical protein